MMASSSLKMTFSPLARLAWIKALPTGSGKKKKPDPL